MALATATAPAVNNNAGALLGPLFTASLRGQITAGMPVPSVYVCWGTANAGTTDTGLWQHVDGVSTQSAAFADAVPHQEKRGTELSSYIHQPALKASGISFTDRVVGAGNFTLVRMTPAEAEAAVGLE